MGIDTGRLRAIRDAARDASAQHRAAAGELLNLQLEASRAAGNLGMARSHLHFAASGGRPPDDMAPEEWRQRRAEADQVRMSQESAMRRNFKASGQEQVYIDHVQRSNQPALEDFQAAIESAERAARAADEDVERQTALLTRLAERAGNLRQTIAAAREFLLSGKVDGGSQIVEELRL